jgi:hypothetical protein
MEYIKQFNQWRTKHPIVSIRLIQTQILWGDGWGDRTTKWLETRMDIDCLAEAVRFELTEDANPRRFSRPVHSTALPSFRVE